MSTTALQVLLLLQDFAVAFGGKAICAFKNGEGFCNCKAWRWSSGLWQPFMLLLWGPFHFNPIVGRLGGCRMCCLQWFLEVLHLWNIHIDTYWNRQQNWRAVPSICEWQAVGQCWVRARNTWAVQQMVRELHSNKIGMGQDDANPAPHWPHRSLNCASLL